MKHFFEFPNPVNEYAARFVAFFVLFFSTVILITDNLWAISLLFIGFLLRLLFGPRLSPFALITLKLIIPLLKNPNKSVPGPPKRFAQFIGALITLIASIIYFFTTYTVTFYFYRDLKFATQSLIPSLFTFTATSNLRHSD